MQFQLISDLHTEFYQEIVISEFLKPSAPYLIIAGDLGNPFLSTYTSFLKQASPLFEKIFMVAGNHEYYGAKSMQETESKIREVVTKFTNIHYLQRECYRLDENTIIAGTTLWSHIPESFQYRIKHSINDYRLIETSPRETSEMHKRDVEWLCGILKNQTERRILIVTHHLPSFELIAPQYKGSAMNYAFASDLESSLFESKENCEKIVAFCSGHTHCSFNQQLQNEVQCYVNPRGYPRGKNSEIENKNYQLNFSFALT